MSAPGWDTMRQMPQAWGGGWEGRGNYPVPSGNRGGSGWLLAGLVVVGLGVLAWYSMGPDLQRYLKIRSM